MGLLVIIKLVRQVVITAREAVLQVVQSHVEMIVQDVVILAVLSVIKLVK